jgi:hypothetical protein
VDVGQAPDAAQGCAIELAGILQTRREVGHVLDRGDPDQVTTLVGEGRDGHRHVLQALFTLFGGDHHLFDDVAALRQSSRRDESKRKRARCEPNPLHVDHSPRPRPVWRFRAPAR